MLPFLRRYHPVVIRDAAITGGRLVVHGERLVGCNMSFPPFELQLKPSESVAGRGIAENGQVLLYDQSLRNFHTLHPRIRYMTCPQCRQTRVLVTDGGSRYLDVVVSHRVEIC